MTDLPAALAQLGARSARNLEVFRRGLVTAVDKTGSPWLATIEGREMPWIGTDLLVGDVATYADTTDPFAWGRVSADGGWPAVPPFEGVVALGGEWHPFAEQQPSSGIGPTITAVDIPGRERVSDLDGVRWTNGVVFSAYHKDASEIGTLGAPNFNEGGFDRNGRYYTGAFPEPPINGSVGANEYLAYHDGSMLMAVHWDIGTSDLPAFHVSMNDYVETAHGTPPVLTYTYDPTFYAGSRTIVTGASGVREISLFSGYTTLPAGVTIDAPTLTAPGADWLCIWWIHAPVISRTPGAPDVLVTAVRSNVRGGSTRTINVPALGGMWSTTARSQAAGDVTCTFTSDTTITARLSAFMLEKA